MRYVSESEATRILPEVLDAVQREPVVIRRDNHDMAVLLSPQEYERLVQVNIQEFQQFCDLIAARAAARGVTEKKLAEILADEG